MFLGQYEHAIDEKGRLIVPAKYRESLGEKFIICSPWAREMLEHLRGYYFPGPLIAAWTIKAELLL